MIFKACELLYNREEPFLNFHEGYGKNFLIKNKKLLGINFNSGKRWQSKSWSKEQVKRLIELVNQNYEVILLGGKSEEKIINEIKQELNREGIIIFSNDFNNSIKEFASLLNICDVVITTDSLALHVATSLKKPVIALFFSTPEWEIESYGGIKKVQSPLFEKYFFANDYNEELANSIYASEVFNLLNSF